MRGRSGTACGDAELAFSLTVEPPCSQVPKRLRLRCLARHAEARAWRNDSKGLPRVGEGWRRKVKERHRRGSARSRHAPVSLLPSSAPRRVSPHAPRGVSEQPVSTVVPRSQPVGRPLAARAQIEVRARRGARARDEERGTRHEARGTGRDEECRRLPRGGRAVKEWCCWMRGARACRMGARHGPLRLRMFKESRKQWDCPGHAQVRRDAEPSRVVIAKLLFMLTN